MAGRRQTDDRHVEMDSQAERRTGQEGRPIIDLQKGGRMATNKKKGQANDRQAEVRREDREAEGLTGDGTSDEQADGRQAKGKKDDADERGRAPLKRRKSGRGRPRGPSAPELWRSLGRGGVSVLRLP